ncbi:MAG: signal peptidase II [Erysipelotrichaceae bacterium]|nr:signal peptidase II [Erysipelotrichaceae bacterium]
MGILFVIIAVLMSLAIIWYLYHNKNIKWYYRIIMLLILAGGIGNAIDRIVSGSVIDFLDFYIFGYDFPIFNISDCCITIAMAGMIVTLFTDKE